MATRPPPLPSLTGATPVGYDPRFGGKPRVPDPAAALKSTVEGNVANLGGVLGLGSDINQFNVDEYTGRLKNYDDLQAQSEKNIGANLRGELSEDVINLLGQQAAERGIGRGVSGSQVSNADYLRALGLTSLERMDKGEGQFSDALKRLDSVKMFDPTTLLLDPNKVYDSNLLANTYTAAPIPRDKAKYETDLAKEGVNAGERGGSVAGAGTRKVPNPSFGIGDNRPYIYV